ncbi:hypothetical protein L596_026722 [Steinernema carpocapsae]|uniref:G-protein coupled receptors family 1 profile domain-containing protein n=1 Tax=Steinernema carpocapsae TaxID=34508 RepID=A0A4U5M289_STECR|nr:hypothetical protein L596_026722 [Steinernema carpocapsae]
MAPSQLYFGSTVLQTINRIVAFALPIPHTVVNLIVIWLTFKKIKPSLSRTFTFNLMIPSFGYGVYLGVVVILGFFDLSQHLGFRAGADVIFLDYVTDFLLYYCTYCYRTLAILIVALTYISFTKPFIYQKLNRTKEMTMLFLGCHILAFLCSLSATTAPNRAAFKYLTKYRFDSEAVPIAILEVVTGCVDFFTFVILVTLYLATRLFLASSMLIIAFGDYRRALLGYVREYSNKIFTTSTKTTMVVSLRQ